MQNMPPQTPGHHPYQMIRGHSHEQLYGHPHPGQPMYSPYYYRKWFFCDICFIHPIFRFWFLVTFGDVVTKILSNLCLHFARQDGQDGKKGKKIPKTNRRKYGMNET